MPNLVQGFGPEGFQPSGGPEVQSPEQKLQSMLQLLQGAPNGVLQMIARILQSREPQQAPQQPEQFDRLFQMPPAIPGSTLGGINAEPMLPTEPPRMLFNPNPGFIRG